MSYPSKDFHNSRGRVGRPGTVSSVPQKASGVQDALSVRPIKSGQYRIQSKKYVLDSNGTFDLKTTSKSFQFVYSPGNVLALWVYLQTGEQVLLLAGSGWRQDGEFKVTKIASLNGAADEGAVVYVSFGDVLATPSLNPTQSLQGVNIEEVAGQPVPVVNGFGTLASFIVTEDQTYTTDSFELASYRTSGNFIILQVVPSLLDPVSGANFVEGGFNTNGEGAAFSAPHNVYPFGTGSPQDVSSAVSMRVDGDGVLRITTSSLAGALTVTDSVSGQILTLFPEAGGAPVQAVPALSLGPVTYYCPLNGLQYISVIAGAADTAWLSLSTGAMPALGGAWT